MHCAVRADVQLSLCTEPSDRTSIAAKAVATSFMRNFIKTPLVILGMAEAGILFSSVYVAAFVLYGELSAAEQRLGLLLPRALVVAGVLVVSLASMGLYQFHQRFFYREAFVRVLGGVIAGGLALAAIYYLLPSVALSRTMTAVAFSYALVLLLLLRFYVGKIGDENVFRRKTLIYGAGERASKIAAMRRRADRRGFQIVGQIAALGDTNVANTGKLTLDDTTLVDMALKLSADEIVVAVDDRRGNLPVRQLLDCRLRGIEVYDLVEFLERETGKIWIDIVSPGWLVFSPGFRVSKLRYFRQRVVDLAVSSILLVVTLPVMMLIAVAIKLEDGFRGPILYRQDRVGRNDKVFSMLKFRSMHVNAETDGEAVWAAESDSRVTRVGSFLRLTRLDELPQLLNVFRGEMSLVGPRPERPQFVASLRESIPYYSERHTVNPGLTGWAQLRYNYSGNKEETLEKLQYDLYYVKNHGLRLDLMIILQTVEVVLWGKGAR